ncbi:HAMP domain-containing histidine kinase [Planomonospora sp. ID67723]|uniref:sensor histidine kinase n=1 Tax=Planomonospora sp. ID67723 TaxID=2738134 RepID=UPI0018C3C3BD|nr:HAMP domain-containing sensor histidine kinase [Planomonospora sp. ID67723]MBG0830711.1 HAMP domain-containing histidine kinase [Planomonospora sp. ID67723]
MRLSTRFAVCLAVLVPLLVLLAGALVLGLAAQDLREERDRQLTVRLRALTPMASTYARRARLTTGTAPDLLGRRLAVAATGAESPGGMYLEVPGIEPLVVGAVPAVLPAAGAGPGEAGKGGILAGGAIGPATFTDGGRRWRFAAADLGVRGDRGRLWVFDPEDRLSGQFRTLVRRVGLTTLVAAGAGAAAGLGLGRFAVRPLTALRRQARGIDAPSRTGARLTTASGVAEIDELAGLVNELLDRRDAAVTRTGEALETARAFAATAAHELRTPLTSMGTNLGLLDHPELDPAERAETVADLVAEHARMQRLIMMLRGLARGELLDPAAFTEVDLTEIVAAAAEDARRRHPHAVITTVLADGLPVRGWAEGLRMIVDNLLDNAALHGADAHGHATITVILSPAPVPALSPVTPPDGPSSDLPAPAGGVVLAVQDAGPGIPPADRETVFARFHRRAGSPGSGLGLTLVHQQTTLHGGTVTVTGPHGGAGGDGGGTRVEVLLPWAGRPAERPAAVSWLK